MNIHETLRLERIKLETLESEHTKQTQKLKQGMQEAQARGEDISGWKISADSFDRKILPIIDQVKENIQTLENQIAAVAAISSPELATKPREFDAVWEDVKHQFARGSKTSADLLTDAEGVQTDAYKKWLSEGGAPQDFDRAWIFIQKRLNGERV